MMTMDQDEKELKRAKNVAYRYLSVRSRSRKEVEQKLADRGFPSACIASVIEHLLRLRYLDDERFARDWAASRVRTRGYGRRRIEQELRERGIGTGMIREAVQELFQDVPELAVARKEAEKKLRTLSRLTPEVRRRRLAGFLERRGFSADIIYSILRTSH
jgi:regulatory protein